MVVVLMQVLRDGYWNGSYAHAGDVIDVPAALVETLEVAGFALRHAAPVPVPAAVASGNGSRAKGSKHGA